jgi:outer membrane immunogenic protein
MAMKKLLLLSSALVVGGQAMAADLPVKAPPVAAAVPYSWTGCHVGGHVGAGWDRSTYSDPGTSIPGLGSIQNFAPAGASFSGHGDAAFLGGVQAGCDYQFASRWVIGVGGDLSWTNLINVTNDPFFGGKNGGPMTLSTRTDRIATFTGRAGYAWDRFLVYGKGGGAYAHDRYAVINSAGINEAFVGCTGPAAFTFVGCNATGGADRWGWTAGVGAEWAFASNWSAMVEYDHYGFGNKTVALSVVNNPSFAITPANLTIRRDIDTVKIGINYHFWSPGPVAAGY